MAVNYRVTAIEFGTGGALRTASATAHTWPTMTEAKAAAEEEHGLIRWAHTDVSKPAWAVGDLLKPSAYSHKVIVAPAAKGLTDIIIELNRRDSPRDLNELRAKILARQGKGPAPQPSTEEDQPA